MADRHRTNAKNLERRVCTMLGGKRRGPLPGSDCVGTPYAVECKRMKRLSLREEHLAQARRQGEAEGLPWVLVIATWGSDEPLVVMPFKRWNEERTTRRFPSCQAGDIVRDQITGKAFVLRDLT